MTFDTDVFIAGGGPAGLAAAIAARRKGFRVMLADAALPPIDKACGEGLMPDALSSAARLGVHIPVSAGFEFRGIRFVGREHSVAAAFPDGAGLGVRRTVLHPLLIEHASRAGVDLLWGTSVRGIENGAVLLDRNRVRARWIIGADGAGSSVRRWAGLDGFGREKRRFAFRRHYLVAPWSDCMEIHWGEGCQFYVTPVSSAHRPPDAEPNDGETWRTWPRPASALCANSPEAHRPRRAEPNESGNSADLPRGASPLCASSSEAHRPRRAEPNESGNSADLPRGASPVCANSSDEICVVLMSRDQRLRIDDALPGFPVLRRRLQSATATTAERGALSSTCRLHSVARGNVALIGDASGTVDAITGEGLCLAFQQAIALADALETGDLQDYSKAHRRMALRPALMSEFMLTMDRRPRLRDRALSALSSRPDLFSNLLAMHVGRLSLSDFAKTSLTLGWKVALA